MTDETQQTTSAATPPAGDAVDEEIVRGMLKTVFDPEIGINIVDLGLVYEIHLEDIEDEPRKKARIVHTLTTPACPIGPMIRAQIEQAVSRLEGIDSVETELVFSPPWDPREMCSDEAKFELGIF
jgi:metal-sulfur cluster biosynthetic enzyme